MSQFVGTVVAERVMAGRRVFSIGTNLNGSEIVKNFTVFKIICPSTQAPELSVNADDILWLIEALHERLIELRK